jgi:hypothetical protein
MTPHHWPAAANMPPAWQRLLGRRDLLRVGTLVIGATDRHAAQPTGPRHSPADVAATIYQALGIDTGTLLYDRQNRPLAVLPEGEAIAGIL